VIDTCAKVDEEQERILIQHSDLCGTTKYNTTKPAIEKLNGSYHNPAFQEFLNSRISFDTNRTFDEIRNKHK
jgi:hypothetical protein